MKEQQDMTMDEERLEEPSLAASAEGNGEVAALTAAPGPELEGAAAAEDEEQENPSAGRSLPEETTAEVNEDWELEEDVPAALPEGVAESEEEEDGEGAAAPLPGVPAAEVAAPVASAAEDAARQQYWRGVLTGSAETVPDAVRERAGVADAGLGEEEREYRLLSAINRSWAVDFLGKSREEVRTQWPRLRRELAGRFRVADDEQELFAALSVAAQDAPRREQLAEVYERHCYAALQGKPLALPAAGKGGAEPYEHALALEGQHEGAALRRRYLPLASMVAEGLEVFAGLEEDAVSAYRVFSHAPELARSVEALARLDERSRQVVYAIAQAEFHQRQPRQKEGFLRTVMRSARRGATGLGFGLGQALAHTSIATMNSLGNSLGEGNAGEYLHEKAASLDVRARIAEELRHLLYEEVRPLQVSESAGRAGQLVVDAAGATPGAIVAFCGGAGFATLGLAGMGEAVAAARRRAPEGSQWLQYLAGIVGGGIQASIYSGMSRVGGQMLSNAIGRFARASGTGAGGYSLAALGALGSVGAEEAKLLFAAKTADVVGLGAQELAARLDKTASHIDWKAYGDNALDVEANLREAAMTLPFILIGSGRVALRHFRSRDAVLGDGYALEQWGIDAATRDAIMKETDMNRQGDMLRDALRGSRRWSAPGFIGEAMRALRLLNTDYYQGFKDPGVVADFLKLPSQNSLVPRPPTETLSADNPEHVRLLQERHGSGEKVNPRRLVLAQLLREEWMQRAHLVGQQEGKGLMLPTQERGLLYGKELEQSGQVVPPRLRPGGFYAPHAEGERMALLRDRVAELHDLTYQMLLASYPLDALSHSTRGLNQLRQASETGRRSMLESVGLAVLKRLTGTPEQEAMNELGDAVSGYFKRRRYSSFPPGWMSRVAPNDIRRLDDYALAHYAQEQADVPQEMRDACRVALGFRACTSALVELLPMLPDFRTALSRGLAPARAYAHVLSRELGVPLEELPEVAELLARHNLRGTDMLAYRRQNELLFDDYRLLSGCEFERARSDGREYWRALRPNGSYTPWHKRRADVANDVAVGTSYMFMPYSYDRMAPLRVLDADKPYDLAMDGKASAWQFTGYDNLCRIALRDTARSWVESAPYAQPGFELDTLHQYIYLGGQRSPQKGWMKPGESPQTMVVDRYMLSTPLRLVQARCRTYWWRQLQSGMVSADAAGEELVKLRVMSPQELARVKRLGKWRVTPPWRQQLYHEKPQLNVSGMNRAMAEHLTDFSLRYFLLHLDAMPLPASAREWFRLAPFCPLQPGNLPETPKRISVKNDREGLTCLHNRWAARELRAAIPSVSELRRAEREGLLVDSSLVAGVKNAVGLNRTLNLEQGWCATQSGNEAMMAGSQPFWKLMEQPLAGWNAMDAAEQQHVRAYVEHICRAELSPEAMEAEARGETPDYVLDGLRNLQEVLEDYPQLHQYGLVVKKGHPLVRRLQPEEMVTETAPFAEPEYEPVAPYEGGRLQEGVRLGTVEGLPEFMREDSRVLPALHLLRQLRRYPASRPFVRREGIQWKGALYGGEWGRRPIGLDEGWTVDEPLWNVIAMLRAIDERQASLPKGERLNALAEELPGLNEVLNHNPLRHVTIYRSLENPSVICRLMPGEPESAHVAARSPYVVQSIAGAHLGDSLALREPEEMYRSYTPLETFRPHRSRMGTERVRRSFNEASVDYVMSNLLSDTTRMETQDHPQGGMVSLRELLLRFAEDTGFSHSLNGIEPERLSYGQIQALRLARELLLCVCGPRPEEAYRRFVEVGKSIRHNEDARTALRRALIGAADSLYREGSSLFLEAMPGKRKKVQERRRYATAPMVTRRDMQHLDAWTRRNKDKDFDGFNVHMPGQHQSGDEGHD